MGKTKELTRQISNRVLQFAVMLIAVIVMAGCFAFYSNAEGTGKVTASSAKIRKEASTSSDQVGSATSGTILTIVSEVTGADGYVWYQVSYDTDKLGYIRSDLMEKTGTTTPSVTTEVTEIQPISATVTGNTVRVRSGASTDVSFITTVTKDTVVTIKGTAAGTDGKTWYQVTFTGNSGEVTGFIREDFLALSGEIVPVVPEADPPVADDPVEVKPEEPVKVKKYETQEEDGVWYLVNYETNYRYKIDDLFSAPEINAKLYEASQKTVKTQKVFIVILILIIVAGGVGATLVIFKMKDMADEAYFSQVEKETITKRQNKQQNVMHTVGKDGGQAKKPTVNGQQRPASKPQQAVNGQPKPAQKPQTVNGQPRPQGSSAAPQQNATAKPQQSAAPQQAAKPQQAVKPQQAAPAQQATKPQQSAAPQQTVAAKPQQAEAPKAAKAPEKSTKPEWKSKNFMADDDDDFEFEFLNWDGEDDL